MSKVALSLEERFWRRVVKNETGCWGWNGALSGGSGTYKYAVICFNSKVFQAHHVSYEVHIGSIPPGSFVHRKCISLTCTNPEHLILETRIPDLLGRFWSRVNKTDSCWLWIGDIAKDGYGRLSDRKLAILPHRYSYELVNGPIPDGLLVCHTCDVRNCVNPSHLFLGTYKDNIQDAVSKGRHIHGERSPESKLTEEQVKDIREAKLDSTNTIANLAKRYGVGRSTIDKVRARLTWKHLP